MDPLKKNFVIRNMNRGDICKVVSLHMKYRPVEEAFLSRFGPEFVTDFMTAHYESELGGCFVMELDGEVIGYLTCTSDHTNLSRRILTRIGWRFIPKFLLGRYKITYGSLFETIKMSVFSISYSTKSRFNNLTIQAGFTELVIAEDFQGRGLGARMMETGFKFFKSKGIKRIQSPIYSKNEPSYRLHEKLGFNKFAEIKTPTHRMIIFVKEIR